jgi:low affinity Fe/Cu permease
MRAMSSWLGAARRTLRHPADRTEGAERGRFERLAESGSFLASSPLFFGVCLIVLVVWMVGLVAGASNQFETAATGLISAVTLVLVALLKNAELRAERAIQRSSTRSRARCCRTNAAATATLSSISRRRSAFTSRSSGACQARGRGRRGPGARGREVPRRHHAARDPPARPVTEAPGPVN